MIAVSKPRERRFFIDRDYLMEEAIPTDYAVIKAHKADRKGNLRFRKVARNFGPDMIGQGKVNIVEVEQIVDEIPPDQVHVVGF